MLLNVFLNKRLFHSLGRKKPNPSTWTGSLQGLSFPEKLKSAYFPFPHFFFPLTAMHRCVHVLFYLKLTQPFRLFFVPPWHILTPTSGLVWNHWIIQFGHFTVWTLRLLEYCSERISARLTLLWRKWVLGCPSSHQHHRKLSLRPAGFHLWSVELPPQSSLTTEKSLFFG